MSLGADPDALRFEFEASGWQVLVLPEGISDTRSFFRGVRAACPLAPPVIRDDHWDALADSLWGGLDELEEDHVAIIWPDSAVMTQSAPKDFAVARDVLSSLTVSLADTKATMGQPTHLAVLLV